MARTHRVRPRLLALEHRVTPALNDHFADATVLAGQFASDFTGNYDFDFATSDVFPFTGEAGEPDHGAASAPLESAWYQWTAPTSLPTTVNVTDFTFSFTVVTAVYTGGSLSTLTEVASDVGEFGATVTFNAVAGTTYFIAVDSAGPGFFDYELVLSSFPRPTNDNFADAVVLDGSVVSAAVGTGTSTGSTAEPGEPNHGEGLEYFDFPLTFRESTWFTWTAPTTGAVKLKVDTDFDFGNTFIFSISTGLAVYTGASVDQLTLTANSFGFTGFTAVNDSFLFSGAELNFNSVAGTTYHIAFAGGSLFPESYTLKLVNYAVPGAVAIDDTAYVVGTIAADNISITPNGAAADGSTGVKVKANFGGAPASKTLSGAVAALEVYGGAGNNSVTVADSITLHVAADFGSGNDVFNGGNGDTVVFAAAGNNVIRTESGHDAVYCGAGHDDIRTGAGFDFVRPDDGNNRVNTGDDDDAVWVLPDIETGVQFTGNNVVDVGGGDDFTEIDSTGFSVVRGDMGDDVLGAGPGSSHITAGDGDDAVRAGDGNNSVSGGSGNDLIFVGRGDNMIDAGSGDDLVSAMSFEGPGSGTYVVQAGSGDDTVRINSDGLSLVFAGSGDDEVAIGFSPPFFPNPAGTGVGIVFGGSGDDILLGGPANDLLAGESDKDLVAGGFGSDLLLGGSGSDLLFDGPVSVTNTKSDSLRKVLTDWDPADVTSYVDVRSRLVVTFNTASRDILLGGGGLDWFWSNDSLDVLDRTGGEIRN